MLEELKKIKENFHKILKYFENTLCFNAKKLKKIRPLSDSDFPARPSPASERPMSISSSYSLGLVVLTLAIVARVFHPDPASAAKAVQLNRYGFGFALGSILLGLGTYCFFSPAVILVIANMIRPRRLAKE